MACAVRNLASQRAVAEREQTLRGDDPNRAAGVASKHVPSGLGGRTQTADTLHAAVFDADHAAARARPNASGGIFEYVEDGVDARDASARDAVAHAGENAVERAQPERAVMIGQHGRDPTSRQFQRRIRAQRAEGDAVEPDQSLIGADQ